MPPKRTPATTNTTRTSTYKMRIKGRGEFKRNGCRPWSSHHASVLYKVALDANGDPVGDVIPVQRFGQLPRSGGNGGYVKPGFKPPEEQRMKARALKAAQDAFTSDRFEVPRPPQLRKNEPEHEQHLCELCKQLGFPCTGVLVDVEGTAVHFPAKVLRSRNSRLRDGGVTVLYHQTSKQAAAAIVASQRMKRGSGGTLGGGIYFADSPEATDAKAQQRGVVLKADVRLGNPKHLRNIDPSITFSGLVAAGFDSVKCTAFNSGDEYVVYNHDQVTNITVHRR